MYTKEIKLVVSQIGFQHDSPKKVKLIPDKNSIETLPHTIEAYIQNLGDRKTRQASIPKVWDESTFRWPLDISKGSYAPNKDNYLSFNAKPKRTIVLTKCESRWGTFWESDFSDLQELGIYQIECEYAFSTPFSIEDNPFQKLIRSYLINTYSQRSSEDIPGIRKASHKDDGILDTTGEYIDTSGGWYDAGDFRKWFALTINNITALVEIIRTKHYYFAKQATEELEFGVSYFLKMISPEGLVYEDVGGGNIRKGQIFEKDWWNENHPGVIADSTDNRITDNIINSGDERKIRSTYNAYNQFAFCEVLVMAMPYVNPTLQEKCKKEVIRAWNYGNQFNNLDKTLYISIMLKAFIELVENKIINFDVKKFTLLWENLTSRQIIKNSGLSGFFVEEKNSDGYRSIVFSCEPALALLKLIESNIPFLNTFKKDAQQRLEEYLTNYLIKDSTSNPFNLSPYGIYKKPPYANLQLFRPAGEDYFVRSFIHPLGFQGMVHGHNSVHMHQAYLFAKAAKIFQSKLYKQQAENLIHWVCGFNPYGLCCFRGFGYHHPVHVNFVHFFVPDITIAGFVGKLDDTPYIETSNAVEWSTQEIWDVPFYYAAAASCHLNEKYY